MNEFFVDLAGARDTVDVNIAAGKALPVFTRLKNTVLVCLVAACAILATSNVYLHHQVKKTNDNLNAITARAKAHLDRQDVEMARILALQEEARKQRAIVIKAILGQKGANAPG